MAVALREMASIMELRGCLQPAVDVKRAKTTGTGRVRHAPNLRRHVATHLEAC